MTDSDQQEPSQTNELLHQSDYNANLTHDEENKASERTMTQQTALAQNPTFLNSFSIAAANKKQLNLTVNNSEVVESDMNQVSQPDQMEFVLAGTTSHNQSQTQREVPSNSAYIPNKQDQQKELQKMRQEVSEPDFQDDLSMRSSAASPTPHNLNRKVPNMMNNILTHEDQLFQENIRSSGVSSAAVEGIRQGIMGNNPAANDAPSSQFATRNTALNQDMAKNTAQSTSSQQQNSNLQGVAGLGSVAKYKNSKLFQKFLSQQKDIVPNPSAPQTAPSLAASASKKSNDVQSQQSYPGKEGQEIDESLVNLVPPPKRQFQEDTPITIQNQPYGGSNKIARGTFNQNEYKTMERPPVQRSSVVGSKKGQGGKNSKISVEVDLDIENPMAPRKQLVQRSPISQRLQAQQENNEEFEDVTNSQVVQMVEQSSLEIQEQQLNQYQVEQRFIEEQSQEHPNDSRVYQPVQQLNPIQIQEYDNAAKSPSKNIVQYGAQEQQVIRSNQKRTEQPFYQPVQTNMTINESTVELVAYSEQIMGDDNYDIAAGIPNQSQAQIAPIQFPSANETNDMGLNHQYIAIQPAIQNLDQQYGHNIGQQALLDKPQEVNPLLRHVDLSTSYQPLNDQSQNQNQISAQIVWPSGDDDKQAGSDAIWPSQQRKNNALENDQIWPSQQRNSQPDSEQMWPSQQRNIQAEPEAIWPSQQPKAGFQISDEARSNQPDSSQVEALQRQITELKNRHQKDKDFYEEALEVRMQQIEEMESKLENKPFTPTSDQEFVMPPANADAKVLHNTIVDLRSQLQQKDAELKHHFNQAQQLQDEIGLLQQRVRLENEMQAKLEQQNLELRQKVAQQEHIIMVGGSENNMLSSQIEMLKSQLEQANNYIGMASQQNAQMQGQPPIVFNPPQTNFEPMASFQSNPQQRGVRPTAISNVNRNEFQTPGYSSQTDNFGTVPKPAAAVTNKRPLNSNQNKNPLLAGFEDEISHDFTRGPFPADDIDQSITFPSKVAAKNSKINPLAPQFSDEESSPITFPSKRPGQGSSKIVNQFNRTEEPVGHSEQQVREQIQRVQNKPAMQQLQNQLQGSAVQQMLLLQSDEVLQQNQYERVKQQEQEEISKNQRQAQLSQIEDNLLQLNLEKDKYKNEYAKLPENPKKGAQMRRKEFLEKELQATNRSIATLKTKLKEMSAL